MNVLESTFVLKVLIVRDFGHTDYMDVYKLYCLEFTTRMSVLELMQDSRI